MDCIFQSMACSRTPGQLIWPKQQPRSHAKMVKCAFCSLVINQNIPLYVPLVLTIRKLLVSRVTKNGKKADFNIEDRLGKNLTPWIPGLLKRNCIDSMYNYYFQQSKYTACSQGWCNHYTSVFPAVVFKGTQQISNSLKANSVIERILAIR